MLGIEFGDGIASTETLNDIVVTTPEGIVPILAPIGVSGFWPGRVTPFTTSELLINVVLSGIVS